MALSVETKGKLKRWGTFAAGCALSLGGLGYAAWFSHDCADAGRGGALTVALAFLILFQNHGSAEKIFNDKDTEKEIAVVTQQALGSLLDVAKQQRWPLTLTSVVGTLFWGFGDILARWFETSCV